MGDGGTLRRHENERQRTLVLEGEAMLASSYPLLDAFWTILIFTGFFLWIWVAISVFMDIFRSHDMGGGMKALWVVGIFILPLLGVLIYLIARGGKMREHAMADAAAADKAQREYIKSVATDNGQGGNVADEISKLAALRDSGALSEQEFQDQKQKLLSA
jgi:Phospholipase_D-nuclease N-terminal/Short C-terminal domain